MIDALLDLFVDVARVDFPDRNLSQFGLACYSVYTPQSYLGLNCTETAFQPMVPTPATRHERLVLTFFDADRVYLVDYPCELTDMTQEVGYKTYAVTCHDDEIFADGFQ